MKKLKLKLEGVKEMLTREQMKKVAGGYDLVTTCHIECPTGQYACCRSSYGVASCLCVNDGEAPWIGRCDYSGASCTIVVIS